MSTEHGQEHLESVFLFTINHDQTFRNVCGILSNDGLLTVGCAIHIEYLEANQAK